MKSSRARSSRKSVYKSRSRRTKRKSRSPVRIKLRKTHALTRFGYSMNDNAMERRKALTRAVKKYGYLPVMRRVNVLYIYNKNLHPRLAAKMTADKIWLKNKYGN